MRPHALDKDWKRARMVLLFRATVNPKVPALSMLCFNFVAVLSLSAGAHAYRHACR